MEDINFFKHHPPLKEENEDFEMNFFNSFNPDPYEECILNPILPFFDCKEDKYTEVIFPSMHLTDFNEEISSLKNNANDNNNLNNNIKESEKIIEKISDCISNYNNFICQETATQSSKNFDLNSNIKLAENTLPGSIISLMKKMGKPISKEIIFEHIKNNFSTYRKANGAKYNGNINSVLNSTLNTSGIFIKVDDNLYYYKEKESMDFIIKTVERELKKKMVKDIKNKKTKVNNSNKSNKSLSKQQKQLSFTHQLGFKICKLDSILNNLIKCRGRQEEYINLNKKLCSEEIQMLENISKQDKYIGMILCIKYFKGIIEKYLKYINKKKKFEKFLNVQKFNEKILNICDKIEKVEFNICGNGNNVNNLKVNQNKSFEEEINFNKHDIWQINNIPK
jgi:hypothetical protein